MEIQGFEIVRSVGSGATSEVFAAKNTSGDLRALKVFSSAVSADPDLVGRLAIEAEVLSGINHANIVSLLGKHSLSAGRFALELEFVDGWDLKVWIRDVGEKILFYEPKLWVLSQIARGLGAAHEKGILHRDLKPENILVSKDGGVKITDFGLARSISRVTVTRLGLLVGSLGYMAPEVINHNKATVASDIFSFGVIAFELLSGRTPFAAETPQGLIQSIVTGEHLRLEVAAPHLPPRLTDLIERCLAVKPENRPESIWLVEGELLTILNHGGFLAKSQEMLTSNIGLREIYEAKHSSLQKQIEDFRNTEEPDLRRILVSCVAELRRLFPDDPNARLAVLMPRRQGSKKHIWLLLPLAIGLFLAFLFAEKKYTSQKLKPPDTGTAFANRDLPPPTEASMSGPQESPREIANRSARLLVLPPAKPLADRPPSRPPGGEVMPREAPKVQFGSLKFDLPQDVEVFVNSVRVPRSQYSNYSVPKGKYQIRMVKEGFLPIENSVEVKANREVVVRAGGAE